jgi:hypothetical protein
VAFKIEIHEDSYRAEDEFDGKWHMLSGLVKVEVSTTIGLGGEAQ